jgi:hypothetical protein
MHWHPFGVYAIPMAKRHADGQSWSRRLHLWHPEARPVGIASPYGVHTHSGTAQSHVLLGALHHHLYSFAEDADGAWRMANPKEQGKARLLEHAWGETIGGQTHVLPANQPHGVTKPPGFAVSLFEQLDGEVAQPFTTWQCLEMDPEELEKEGPVSVGEARREAMAMVEETLYGVGG